MKQFIFPLVFSVLSAVVFAARIAPPTLPPSAFADTEASTNIAIAVQDASRSFSFSLALDASASNCVEVAVGSDAAPAVKSLA